MNNHSGHFRNLIAANNFTDFFSEIIEYADHDEQNSLLLLQSQYGQNEKNYSHGIMAHQDYTITKNKIRQSLIEMIGVIFKGETQKKENNMKATNKNSVEDYVTKYQELSSKVDFSDYSRALKNAVEELKIQFLTYAQNALANETFDVSQIEWETLMKADANFEAKFRRELSVKEKEEVAALLKLVDKCREIPTVENAKELAVELYFYNEYVDYRDRVKDASEYGGRALQRVLREMKDEVDRLWSRVK